MSEGVKALKRGAMVRAPGMLPLFPLNECDEKHRNEEESGKTRGTGEDADAGGTGGDRA